MSSTPVLFIKFDTSLTLPDVIKKGSVAPSNSMYFTKDDSINSVEKNSNSGLFYWLVLFLLVGKLGVQDYAVVYPPNGKRN